MLARLLGVTVLCATLALEACAPVTAQARVGPDSFAPMVKRVLPAVVHYLA